MSYLINLLEDLESDEHINALKAQETNQLQLNKLSMLINTVCLLANEDKEFIAEYTNNICAAWKQNPIKAIKCFQDLLKQLS